MNEEQIDFLRQVVREVRLALANQSMNTKIHVSICQWPTLSSGIEKYPGRYELSKSESELVQAYGKFEFEKKRGYIMDLMRRAK